jgi:hypothetical protein
MWMQLNCRVKQLCVAAAHRAPVTVLQALGHIAGFSQQYGLEPFFSCVVLHSILHAAGAVIQLICHFCHNSAG